jgi:phenylacetate-CoA ligase
VPCGTYHIFEDINYLEVRPEHDRDDGLGVLLGTNLHNYAMPMIRYEQNDLGKIEASTCACGWNFRSLVNLQGRKNDSFLLPSGRTISSGFLLDATYEILLTYRTAVKDFCLIQQSCDQVVLEVVAGQGWNAETSAAVKRRFETFLEPGVRFSVATVEVCAKTKSGERNPIISRVSR